MGLSRFLLEAEAVWGESIVGGLGTKFSFTLRAQNIAETKFYPPTDPNRSQNGALQPLDTLN